MGPRPGVGSGAVLPAAATGGSQAYPSGCRQVWETASSPIAFLTLPAMGSLPLLLKDTGSSEESGQGA